MEEIKPEYVNRREKEVLKWAEKNIFPTVKSLNDERVRVAGINSPQEYPLPPPLESIRACYLRTKERIKSYLKEI